MSLIIFFLINEKIVTTLYEMKIILHENTLYERLFQKNMFSESFMIYSFNYVLCSDK